MRTAAEQPLSASPREIAALKARAGDVAALAKALSHPNRLLIACQLMEGEQSVSEIEARSGVRQPVLSRELARLRQLKLVVTRRDSKLVYYRLADDRLERLLSSLCEAFGRPQNLTSRKARRSKADNKRVRRKTAPTRIQERRL